MRAIQIISDGLCCGPVPEPDDEVKQKLIVSEDGRVQFIGFSFGNKLWGHTVFRKRTINIDQTILKEMLDLVFEYFSKVHMHAWVTDIGSWKIRILNEGIKSKTHEGSMCGVIEVRNIDLGKYIRENIPIEDLWVFGDVDDDWDEDFEDGVDI
jgi:hypothetical protein